MMDNKLDPWKVTADVISILVPLTLLGFMTALHQLDGKDVESSFSFPWANAMAVLATLFPIFFASIFGRLMYEASRWKLETGSTLGSLEQLLGSRTVGSALTTQIQLRSLNPLGLSLLLFWTLSPLGSQSILRILTSRLSFKNTTSHIAWFDNLHESGCADPDNDPSFRIGQRFVADLQLLFTTLLMAPEPAKLDPMDLWGNIKIPYLPTGYGPDDNKESLWRDGLVAPLGAEEFSSLAGIPIAQIPIGNTTLSVESTYIQLDCHEITVNAYDHLHIYWDWPKAANGTWQGTASTTDPGILHQWKIAVNNFVNSYWTNDSSSRQHELSESQEEDLSRQIDMYNNSPERFIDESDIRFGDTTLLFQGQYRDLEKDFPLGHLRAMCDVRQVYVESSIVCERPDSISTRKCKVTSQRPSTKRHASEKISHFNFPSVWGCLSRNLPESTARLLRPDLVLAYLSSPSLASTAFSHYGNLFEGRTLDRLVFSQRLGQILNTYLLLSQTQGAAVGASAGAPNSTMTHNITAGVPSTTPITVYSISRLWITLGCISCGALLLAGIASMVFRWLARGPEVLGFTSTVVRDSRFIDLPPSTGRMNGMDIIIMMKEHRIRYGHTDLTLEGQPLLGVGREAETARLRDREDNQAHA
jgi:hypothetical protein